MKSATRFLTLIGAGIMVATTFAAPAQAAPVPTPAAQLQRDRDRDRDRDWHGDWDFEGFYDSRRECEWQGRRGERRDWWEAYDCDRVQRGSHRGDWKLRVLRDDDDDWDWRRR